MIKNVLKRQTILITITVITLCIGLLGVSYAVFFSVNDGKEQTVTSGDLVIQFQEDKETITTASVPQNDTDGKNNSYTFSVTNVGSLPMIYDIYLYEDPEAVREVSATKTETDNMIPHDYLKIQLDEEDVKTLKAFEEQEGNTVTENDITKIKINTNKLFVAAKTGTESTEGQVTEGNTAPNVKTHTIRIWIDEKAPESIIGNTVALQLEVFGEVGSSSQTSGSDSPKPTIKPFSEVIVVDNTTIFADEAGNLRYAGADPANYVWFNCDDYNGITQENAVSEKHCEKWRIIGVMKNVEKEDGSQEDLVKIVRADSIGNYSWDNKNASTGAEDGGGKNDWSTAELMYLLNPNYGDHQLNSVTANNSLYWNSGNGKCSNSSGNATTTCDFRSTGLKGDDSGPTKSMIESVKWNLGGIPNYNTETTPGFYNAERGEETYNKQPTTWNGKVGLIYPSDYGYATAGGTKKTRQECLAYQLYNWSSGDYKTDCANNSWLKPSSDYLWTLTPYSDRSGYVFGVYYTGSVFHDGAFYARVVSPSLYLTSDVGIKEGGGTGEAEHPYILEVAG